MSISQITNLFDSWGVIIRSSASGTTNETSSGFTTMQSVELLLAKDNYSGKKAEMFGTISKDFDKQTAKSCKDQ